MELHQFQNQLKMKHQQRQMQDIQFFGGEIGHILAIVPVTEAEKAQGYRFRIIDSANGHDGLYKSVADANKVVKGNLRFKAIIKP